MIGNNAGLSMLGGVDKKTLDENPGFKRLIPIIKQYEELRHRNYFSDSIRTLLRQPGKEFTLVQGAIVSGGLNLLHIRSIKLPGSITLHRSGRSTMSLNATASKAQD